MGDARTLLVVGARGFVGEHLLSAAPAAGFSVVAAARGSGEADLVCDLCDDRSVSEAVKAAEPDAVVNLAGLSSVSRSFEAPVEAFEVNTVGAVRVLEAVACHAPEAHVLCVSSGDVYGSIPESRLPATEENEARPLSPYAASKAAMELACSQYGEAAGLTVTVVRSFNHTGPGQSDGFAASSFARQIAEAERSRAAHVVLRTGNLELTRDFSDVRDIVRAYLMLLEGRIAGVFNACSGQPVLLRALVDGLSEHARIPVRAEVESARLRGAEVASLYGSSLRLQERTGWKPELPLSRTLGDLLAWWRERLAA
jgi:GDP-4-dehydro-6-deoxy-D-mannose reductase